MDQFTDGNTNGLILASLLAWALVFGIFTALIADDRKRETKVWFWLGAIFGPIALFTIAALKDGD